MYRELHNLKWDKQTIEEQFADRNYNPANVLVYEKQRIKMERGTVFRAKDYLYCLTVDTSLGFCGLIEYAKNSGRWEQANEIFLQADYDTEEPLALYEKKGERALLSYLLQWF